MTNIVYKFNSTILAVYSNKLVSILFGIVMVPFYINELGMDVYGYIALFSLYGIIVSNLDFGIFSSINKELASSISDAEKINIPNTIGFIELIVIGLLGLLIILFGIGFVFIDWFKTELMLVTCIICIWGCIKILDNLYRQTLFGLQLQKYHSLLSIFLTFIKAVVIYLLIKHIGAYFYFYLIGTLIPIFIGILFFRKKIKRNINYSINYNKKSLNKKLVELSKKFFLINVLGQVLLQVDKIFVFIFSIDMNKFGFYTLGLTIAGMVLAILAPMQQYLFSRLPLIHKLGKTKDSFIYFSNSFRTILILLFLTIFSYPILAPKLLSLWLGVVGESFDLFFQIYIILISYVILSLINFNVLYLQVTLSPSKGIRIILFSITSYILFSILFYSLDYYKPIYILLLSYLTGYIYSKFILVKQLDTFKVKDSFIRWEFIIIVFCLASLVITFINKNEYTTSITSFNNFWYLSKSMLFILAIALSYKLVIFYKLIK